MKPYRERSRFYNMEIVIVNGRRLARTKPLVVGKRHSFWVDDELYKEYLAEGHKPVEL
tara:strand:- start:11318 stop:11491 length:174 start_codon:yes stop_codon:yes gene_type:complete